MTIASFWWSAILSNFESNHEKQSSDRPNLNNPVGRPSLLGSVANSGTAKHQSILDSLTKSPLQEIPFESSNGRFGSKKVITVTFLFLAAAAAVFWGISEKSAILKEPAMAPKLAAISAAPTPAIRLAPPSPYIAPPIAPVVPEKSPQERKIEEMIAAPLPALAPAQTVKQTPTQNPSLISQKNTSQSPAEKPKVDLLPKATAASKPAPKQAPIAKATPKPANVGAVKAMAPANNVGTARSRQDSLDRDVDLIAAVMAHGRGTKTSQMGAAVPGSGPLSAQSVAASSGSKSASTIAQLVQGCDAQPNGQRLDCVRTICENSWGKANACPVALAPRAARVQKVN
jgi:hypothetical protein